MIYSNLFIHKSVQWWPFTNEMNVILAIVMALSVLLFREKNIYGTNNYKWESVGGTKLYRLFFSFFLKNNKNGISLFN